VTRSARSDRDTPALSVASRAGRLRRGDELAAAAHLEQLLVHGRFPQRLAARVRIAVQARRALPEPSPREGSPTLSDAAAGTAPPHTGAVPSPGARTGTVRTGTVRTGTVPTGAVPVEPVPTERPPLTTSRLLAAAVAAGLDDLDRASLAEEDTGWAQFTADLPATEVRLAELDADLTRPPPRLGRLASVLLR
jgi:hypothetical protein